MAAAITRRRNRRHLSRKPRPAPNISSTGRLCDRPRRNRRHLSRKPRPAPNISSTGRLCDRPPDSRSQTEVAPISSGAGNVRWHACFCKEGQPSPRPSRLITPAVRETRPPTRGGCLSVAWRRLDGPPLAHERRRCCVARDAAPARGRRRWRISSIATVARCCADAAASASATTLPRSLRCWARPVKNSSNR